MTPSRAPEWLGDGPRVPVAYTYMNGRECYALALGSTGTHPINCRQGPLVGRADRSEPNASAPRAAGQLDWTVDPPPPARSAPHLLVGEALQCHATAAIEYYQRKPRSAREAAPLLLPSADRRSSVRYIPTPTKCVQCSFAAALSVFTRTVQCQEPKKSHRKRARRGNATQYAMGSSALQPSERTRGCRGGRPARSLTET
jgi:hypothetical protein